MWRKTTLPKTWRFPRGILSPFDPDYPLFVKRATQEDALAGGHLHRPRYSFERYRGTFNGSQSFAGERKVPVALVGRVPVKVNSEGGAIAVGDRIAPSSVPGVGKKASSFAHTVGIALEPFDGAGVGKGRFMSLWIYSRNRSRHQAARWILFYPARA